MIHFRKTPILIFTSVFLILSGCKVKVALPEWFGEVQECMRLEKYDAAIELLESKKIPGRQKTDWYYYDYGVALYKSSPKRTRYSIPMLTTASRFSPHDRAILYHLGKCFYEIGEYKKAEEYFSESLHGTQNDYLIFSEKTGADFWLAILNCMGGNYGLAEEILSKSGGGAGIEMLRKIHGGEAGLKEICAAEGLALEEKFRCIDFYFNPPDRHENLAAYAENCEAALPLCDKETADFINANLLYFYLTLEKNDSAENLLKNFGDYPMYLIDSENPLVNERFYRNLTFYYWKKGDAAMATSSLENFKRYRFKPVDYKSKGGGGRFKDIQEYFASSEDFQRLLK